MSLAQIGVSSTVYNKLPIEDRIVYIYGNASNKGTLNQFFVNAYTSWGSSDYARGAIFVSSSRELVAQTSPFYGNAQSNWLSASIGPSSITEGEDYIIALWGNENDSDARTGTGTGWYDSGRDYSASDDGNFSANYPTLDSQGNYSDVNMKYLMFLSYDIIPTTHYDEGDSLRIYVSCNNYPNNYIDCWATRFQEGNWDVVFETFLGSGARDFLFDNVIPGAQTELYNILGTPYYRDTSYSSSNTIILEPNYGYGLSGLRERRVVAVKSISDTFLTPNKFSIKVETTRLDT